MTGPALDGTTTGGNMTDRLKMSDTVHCHDCGIEVHPLVIGDTVAHFNCSTCGASFATSADGERYVIPCTVYFGDSELVEYIDEDTSGPVRVVYVETSSGAGSLGIVGDDNMSAR